MNPETFAKMTVKTLLDMDGRVRNRIVDNMVKCAWEKLKASRSVPTDRNPTGTHPKKRQRKTPQLKTRQQAAVDWTSRLVNGVWEVEEWAQHKKHIGSLFEVTYSCDGSQKPPIYNVSGYDPKGDTLQYRWYAI